MNTVGPVLMWSGHSYEDPIGFNLSEGKIIASIRGSDPELEQICKELALKIGAVLILEE